MNTRTKSWIVSTVLAVTAAALTIFAGVSVKNMVKPSSPSVATEPSGDETLSPSGSEDPGQPTEPSSGQDPSEPPTSAPPAPASIRRLTSQEMVALRELYSADHRIYTVTGSRNGKNQPDFAADLSREFAERFSNVKVFSDAGGNNASLCFVVENEASYVSRILDILKSLNIRATFFVKFDFVAEHADLCERILLERHELASVGASSPDNGLAIYGLEDQENDIMTLHNLVKDRFDYTMSKFMYLHDVFTDLSMAFVTQMGYELWFYSAAYEDHSENGTLNDNRCLLSLEQQLHPGAVYLMHAGNPTTARILPNLVYYIQGQGYTVSKLP